MITYSKYVKVYYEKRTVTNCSPCRSYIKQELLCSCREKLSNARMISLPVGYLQVLHVMMSPEAMAEIETNTCQDER